jgi:hypothetical protein
VEGKGVAETSSVFSKAASLKKEQKILMHTKEPREFHPNIWHPGILYIHFNFNFNFFLQCQGLSLGLWAHQVSTITTEPHPHSLDYFKGP